jgi:putative ABC transport system ATP-binding protein
MHSHTEPSGPPQAIEVENLTKRYGTGPGATLALRGVTFGIDHASFVAITGPSGCGKSTLLNIVGALDRPTSGKVWIDGLDVSGLSNLALAKMRNKKLGFVFQDFNLIRRMSAAENVELPLLIAGLPSTDRRRRALALLKILGIDSSDKPVHQFSGGEQQRIAVARALANDPAIVLGDEPTGNLDSENTEIMMEILEDLNGKYRKTLVIISHNPEVARRAQRVISMRDGRVERIIAN